MSEQAQFLKFISIPSEADEDHAIEIPAIIPLRKIEGIFPLKEAPEHTAIHFSGDGYYRAGHQFEIIAQALEQAETFGPVIDLITFAADEAIIQASLTPSRNRELALARGAKEAKNKIN